MLKWLLPGDCPVEGEAKAQLDDAMRRLADWMRVERLADCRVVTPTEQFYPDSYDGTVDSMVALVTRTIELLNTALASTGQRVTGETVRIDPTFSADPASLIGTVVQQLCAERLADGGFSALFPERFESAANEHAGELAGVTPVSTPGPTETWMAAGAPWTGGTTLNEAPQVNASEFTRLASLLSVFTGFGIFTGNSSVGEASCSGGSCQTVGSLAALSLREYGYAMARHVELCDRPVDWAKHLRPDLKATFRQAQRFLKRDVA